MDIFKFNSDTLRELDNNNIEYFIDYATNSAFIKFKNIRTIEEIFGNIIDSVFIKYNIQDIKFIDYDALLRHINSTKINSTSSLYLPYKVLIKFKTGNYVLFDKPSISKLNKADDFY